MRLTLTVDGTKVLDRTLARYIDNLTDATPAFQRIADQFAQNNLATFARQGPGWPALSARYAAYKARHFPGRPILVRTGTLRDSLTSRPFGIDRITPQHATFGTAVPYAKWHQHGTPTMPARPPLNITEDSRQAMVKTLQRYLVTGVA